MLHHTRWKYLWYLRKKSLFVFFVFFFFVFFFFFFFFLLFLCFSTSDVITDDDKQVRNIMMSTLSVYHKETKTNMSANQNDLYTRTVPYAGICGGNANLRHTKHGRDLGAAEAPSGVQGQRPGRSEAPTHTATPIPPGRYWISAFVKSLGSHFWGTSVLLVIHINIVWKPAITDLLWLDRNLKKHSTQA